MPTTIFGSGEPFPGYDDPVEVGRGAHGVVFRARRRSDGQTVAIKKLYENDLQRDSEAFRRLSNEIEALRRLDCPYVVKILAADLGGRCPHYVMEFVEGSAWRRGLSGNLDDPRLPGKGRFLEWGKFFRQLSLGLAHAHALKIVHRDLKPENVLIAPDGTPKIGDFGLAKEIADDSRTQIWSGAPAGTRSYMPPERMDPSYPREQTAAIDIWAVGVILCETLTGNHPFAQAGRRNLEHQIINACPPWMFGIPSGLRAICHKCLQKRPEDRYRNGQELADDFKLFLKGGQPGAPVPSLSTWCWNQAKMHRWQSVSAMVAVICVLSSVVVVEHFRYIAKKVERDKALQEAGWASRENDHEGFVVALKTAERLPGPAIDVEILRGEDLLNVHRNAEAMAVFESITAEYPENVSAHALAALACLDHHQISRYQYHLGILARLAPQTPDEKLNVARATAQVDPANSVGLINEAIKKWPDWPRARLERGVARSFLAREIRGTNEIEAAIHDLEAAADSMRDRASISSELLHAQLRAMHIYASFGMTNSSREHEQAADVLGQLQMERGWPPVLRITQLEESGRNEEALKLAPEFRRSKRFLQQVVTRHASLLLARGDIQDARNWLEPVHYDDYIAATLWWISEAEVKGRDAASLWPELRARFDHADLEGIHCAAFWLQLGKPLEARRASLEFRSRHGAEIRGLPRAQHNRISEYLAGLRDAASLLRDSDGNQADLCQAHCYIGWQHLASGDRQVACEHFTASVATGVYDLSAHRFSKILLHRLESDSRWPDWIRQGSARRPPSRVLQNDQEFAASFEGPDGEIQTPSDDFETVETRPSAGGASPQVAGAQDKQASSFP